MDSFDDNTAVFEVKKNFQMLLQSVEKDRSREARLDRREQSLKRASIQFETEVEASKQHCQRRRLWEEVECKQQLDQLLTRGEDTREELAECREKLHKTKQHYEQKLLAAQKRRTEAEAAHEEVEEALKAKIAELMTETFDQQRDINNLECEVSEARQQAELAFRKREAAEEQVKLLAGCQTKLLQTELRMKELEAQVSQLSSDETVGKNVKSCLLKLPRLEKENAQLVQENSSLKEIQENTVLLREKVISLEKKLERSDKMKAGSANWQVLYKELKKKCEVWEMRDSSGRQTLQSPQQFQDRITELQRSNVLLMEKQGHLQASLHSTEEALKVTEEKLSAAQELLVKEKSTSQQQADFIKRLQRKLLFVTKERDGFKQILDSYESDVTVTGPSLSQHKAVDKSAELRQIASLEAELATCREQLLPAQMRCQLLENKLAKAKENQTANVSYTLETDQKIILALRETVASLEQKLESVEQENNRLESINERRLLQGDYDPTKTKVLHLCMNPATLAQQRQAAELARLRAEVEQLRQKLQENQPDSSEPGAEPTTAEPSSSKEVSELKAQVTSAELKNKRLMEVFKKTSQNFREVCYALLGYRIDLVSDNQYKLQNMYAESPDDILLFQETEAGTMQMLENAFSTSLSDKATTYLQGADSIPAFLSSVTLELFSRQTMCVPP